MCGLVCSVYRLKARSCKPPPALYDPIFTSLESTCWHSLWCFVFIPTPLWCPPYFQLTLTWKNILRRGKINQCAPINAVKVDRQCKQHIDSHNQFWVAKACSVKAQMLPFFSCLTLFRTMKSAASAEKGYRIVFFFPFGPSEAGPMQQLPTRHDADVLLQLKEGITDSVITGIVEESSEWPIACWV